MHIRIENHINLLIHQFSFLLYDVSIFQSVSRDYLFTVSFS